jgi:hypothetical protein
MTKVFWFSRHAMTHAQKMDLVRIYGDVEITPGEGTVTKAQDIIDMAGDVDVLAVVLPPNLLADLVNPRVNMKPVIRSINKRVSTGVTIINPDSGKDEAQYEFQHEGWERVVKIEVVTERL